MSVNYNRANLLGFVAFLLLSACSKDVIPGNNDGDGLPMTIQPEVVSTDGALKSNDGGATKATLINEAAGLRTQGFGLSLYDGTTALKSKVEMEYKSGAWAPKGGTMDWKWPAGRTYSFYAWSPADLPVGEVTSTGVPAFTYSGIANQKDIMLGTYTGTGNKGAAPIKFYHPLASIQFKTGKMTNLKTLNKIELEGVITSGTCTPTMSGSSTTFAWSALGTTTTTLSQTGLSVASTTSGTAIGTPFLTLPQTSQPLTVKITDTDNKVITATIAAPALAVGHTAVYTIDYDGLKVTLSVRIKDWGAGQSEAVTMEEKLNPYVEIAAKYDGTNISTLKWYKENLAISASGKREYNNTGHINGDYFQWATYAGFCGNASDPDKGLLIYSSFTSNYCGDAANSVTFKGANRFKLSDAPYYEGTDPQKPYSKYYTPYATLELSDDAANIFLGGTWRTPTQNEFAQMIKATFCAKDDVTRGWYVFSPTDTHPANTVASSIPSDLSKDDALLFFPYYSGYVADGTLYTNDETYYWTSQHGTNVANGNAYFWVIGPKIERFTSMEDKRFYGLQIRPVSE